MTLATGASTINSVNNGGGATLTLVSLTHTTGATVSFTGSGAVNLLSNTGLPATGVTIPFATVNNAAFAQYTGASTPFTIAAITPIPTATLTGLSATGDYKLTANVTVPGAGATINSLDLNGFNVTGTATLTVSSGGVINSAAPFASPGRRSQRHLLGHPGRHAAARIRGRAIHRLAVPTISRQYRPQTTRSEPVDNVP